ncbi:MAG TPA: M48 family metalloprotease [Planctomycetota bacterium]|nr:M48 family metalloprotease [Planctomycetota bacterium]
MGLPLTFLLGAAVLVLREQFGDTLPGAGRAAQLLPYCLLLPVPWLLVWWVTAVLRRRTRLGVGRGLTLALRLLPLSVPAIYSAIVLAGDLPAVATAWAGASSLQYLVVVLLPLLVLEVSYRQAERALLRLGARRGIGLPASSGHIAFVWLVVLPVAMMAAIADATRELRWLHVFFTSTALGHLIGFLGTILLLSVVLPLLFRWLLPTSRRLPPGVVADVHATARALGFPTRAILVLRTDLRIANAAMVGPLPWPRYLVLTDALIALLDKVALRGVVAHEVGHARAGHPGLLLLVFVLVPLFSFHAFWLALRDADTTTTAMVLGAVGVLALVLLRVIAHRFEYEADQLSAAALGGALPCVEALRRVGQLGARVSERGTLRHPADSRRIAQLLRWELDPAERERFARGGRRVRRMVFGLVATAAVVCAVTQVRLWPLDAAVLAHYTGDFPGASARLDRLPWLPKSLEPALAELRGEVAAALELVPTGGPWIAVQDRLAEGGVERGVELLRRGDAAAALPWLSLALSRSDPEPWRQTLYLLARAAVDGDRARAERLADHLARLEPPTELSTAVAEFVAHIAANR